MKNKAFLIAFAMLASATGYVSAQEELPGKFYRGGMDDQVVVAPNGAMVNQQYLNNIMSRGLEQPRLIKVRDGVHVLRGYSLSNYTFIEGKTGLIAFDTGNNMGMGRGALEHIREITDLPVKNIIYSHNHYTGGAKAYADDAAKRGVEKVETWGHPDLENELRSSSIRLGPMLHRRVNIQLGFYLPATGPDAYFGPTEPSFDDPEDQANGHLPTIHTPGHGEVVEIDGLTAIFYHVISDTDDSIVVHFPELDMVIHNAAAVPVAFPLYTLRGANYRDPLGVIEGLDLIRGINPKYLVGAHGEPLNTRESSYDFLTTHRDLYSFIYNQSIRGINKGMTPDEIVAEVIVPSHLDNDPRIFPAYIDNEYSLRGQYRGLVGWYAEDTALLHPPLPSELGLEILTGFGGADSVIAASENAFKEGKYNLAARLVSYVLDVDANNEAARLLKAQALRKMAYSTRSGIQSRNFLLTHALHLEGKLNWKSMPPHSFVGLPTTESMARQPVGTYVKLLESQIDPEQNKDLQTSVGLRFTDKEKGWTIAIRRGVAEVTDGVDNNVVATLNISRMDWLYIRLRQKTFLEVLETRKATVDGDLDTFLSVIEMFS